MNTQTNEFDILSGIVSLPTIARLNSGDHNIRPSTYKKIAKGLAKDFGKDSELTLSILQKIKPTKQTQ